MARRTYARARRSTSRPRRSTGRAAAPRRSYRSRASGRRSTRAPARQQVVRLEIVQSPENTIARPPIGQMVAAGPRKAMF